MGKAKMFGAVAVIIGLLLGVLAYVLVHVIQGQDFSDFLLYTFLPIMLVTIGLLAILIGVLLMIYG